MPKHSNPLGPVGQLIQLLVDHRVAEGPFAGMRYVGQSSVAAYLPKLLGTYERELRSAWARMTQACLDGTLINLGSAEGYYAVGALRGGTFSRVICYEQDAEARRLLTELARLNDIRHGLEINGRCDPATFGAVVDSVGGPIAILCDVEGDENVLLDPAAIISLVRCHLLVELHETASPGITDRLRARFEGTHRIEFIPVAVRTVADLPARPWLLHWFPRRNKLRWLSEGRIGDTPWLYLAPLRG